MRILAILLNLCALTLAVLRVHDGNAITLPLVLTVSASISSLIAICLARHHFMGSKVRPPQRPLVFVDLYQDLDRLVWHATFRVLCHSSTKVSVDEYSFPLDLESQIGFEAPSGATRRAKDQKKKHLYVPAVIVDQRLKPGRPVHIYFKAKNLDQTHGVVFFNISHSFVSGGGSDMLEIPIGNNLEAIESFQDLQRKNLVTELTKSGYPPF